MNATGQSGGTKATGDGSGGEQVENLLVTAVTGGGDENPLGGGVQGGAAGAGKDAGLEVPTQPATSGIRLRVLQLLVTFGLGGGS